jgi:hypothetical protein
VDLSRLAAENRGVPSRLRIAVNGDPEIAGADPLLYDFLEFSRGLFLFIRGLLSKSLR